MGADTWFDHTGDYRANVGTQVKDGDADLIKAITKRAMDCSWARAAGHWLGRGLEQGSPRLEPARKVRQEYLTHGAP